jgi:hypothetical protein
LYQFVHGNPLNTIRISVAKVCKISGQTSNDGISKSSCLAGGAVIAARVANRGEAASPAYNRKRQRNGWMASPQGDANAVLASTEAPDPLVKIS